MSSFFTQSNEQISYQLYQELSSEIFNPIDDVEISIDLRFELYSSKLTFLYNIQEQCFRAINSYKESSRFTHHDLITIQKAIDLTKDFISHTVKERLLLSLERGRERFVSVKKYTENS